MPDEFPVMVPRAIEIGTKLKENKDENRRLIGELERLNRQALEAAEQAQRILAAHRDVGGSNG
jgi:hypothetical protein